MANYSIIITTPARNDLDGIYRYFSEQLLTPTTGSKTVKNIEDEIKRYLSFMPFYPLADNKPLASIGVRRMVVKKYLVFFVIDEEKKVVNVIRIIHGARNWQRVLSKEIP